MAAAIVRAIDQQAAHALRAHFPEGDFLRAGRHATIEAAAPADRQIIDPLGAATAPAYSVSRVWLGQPADCEEGQRGVAEAG